MTVVRDGCVHMGVMCVLRIPPRFLSLYNQALTTGSFMTKRSVNQPFWCDLNLKNDVVLLRWMLFVKGYGTSIITDKMPSMPLIN